MKVRWSETAANDLEDIYEFIANDRPEAALRVVDSLLAAVDLLATHPHLGRPAELGTRKLVQPPFVIVYRITKDVIEIDAIFHGRRRYQY